MIPTPQSDLEAFERIPRESGDDPLFSESVFQGIEYSPRERG